MILVCVCVCVCVQGFFPLIQAMLANMHIVCAAYVVYAYMVVSQNKGTPTQTPKYYSPYYGDPPKGTPNFGKPPYIYI